MTKIDDCVDVLDAQALAERVHAAIDDQRGWWRHRDTRTADHERVNADLAGIIQHDGCRDDQQPCPDARRYSEGLQRTAELYGVSDAL